jgi:hypothetical protein
MTQGRIITGLSALHGPSHTRYVVLLDEREIAYAEVPREESERRAHELLVRQLTLQAFQGMPDLPRGWLNRLPEAVGTVVRSAVKLELLAMRASVYMLEHGMGLEPTTGIGVPGSSSVTPPTTCAVALTDEEAAARRDFVVTDRAQLLLEPTDDNDSCDRFTFDDVAKDCPGDGHYLCLECKRLTASARRQLLGRPDTDDTQE